MNTIRPGTSSIRFVFENDLLAHSALADVNGVLGLFNQSDVSQISQNDCLISSHGLEHATPNALTLLVFEVLIKRPDLLPGVLGQCLTYRSHDDVLLKELSGIRQLWAEATSSDMLLSAAQSQSPKLHAFMLNAQRTGLMRLVLLNEMSHHGSTALVDSLKSMDPVAAMVQAFEVILSRGPNNDFMGTDLYASDGIVRLLEKFHGAGINLDQPLPKSHPAQVSDLVEMLPWRAKGFASMLHMVCYAKHHDWDCDSMINALVSVGSDIDLVLQARPQVSTDIQDVLKQHPRVKAGVLNEISNQVRAQTSVATSPRPKF